MIYRVLKIIEGFYYLRQKKDVSDQDVSFDFQGILLIKEHVLNEMNQITTEMQFPKVRGSELLILKKISRAIQ